MYLRHRAGHQLAAALTETRAGASKDFTVIGNDSKAPTNTVAARLLGDMRPFDVSPGEGYFFASLDQLPLPDKTFREKFDRDGSYKAMLAGQSVGDVLTAVQEGLSHALSIDTDDTGTHIHVNGDGRLPK